MGESLRWRRAGGGDGGRIRADHANLESGDGNEPSAGGAAGLSCPVAGAGRRGIRAGEGETGTA